LGGGRVQVVVQAHEVDALLPKVRDQRHQVFERAAQPVDFPDHERIAEPQPAQQQLQLRRVFGRGVALVIGPRITISKQVAEKLLF
jgi:hypothetical protein